MKTWSQLTTKTLQSSNYMSDELCKAILDYHSLIRSKQNEFKFLLDNLENKQASLILRQNELFNLRTQLNIIEDNLVTANATGQPTADLINQLNTKQLEVSNKNTEINQVNSEIVAINNQINLIKQEVAIENNFTPEQIIERNNYIHEKVWSNDHYFNEKELYEEGFRQLEKIHQPIIQYKIGIVDFLKVVQCKKDWHKLKKYDIVTIKYPEFNTNIKAKIIEIERDDDGNAINLIIANADNIRNGFIEHKDLIARFSSSSARVDMSKFKWDETQVNYNEIRQALEGEWDANTRRIKAGVNESVEISRKGITITNPDFPHEMVLMNAGIVGVSIDNGQTFKNAITTRGVVGERIFGRLLAGVNLIIDASDSQGQKTFTVDETGVKIKGVALTIEGGLPPDQLDPTFKESLVELNKSYTNGIRIDTTDGLVVTRSDDKVKSIFNATDGIKIQVKEGSNFVNKFYYDTTTSRLVVDGEIHARSMKINGSDVLTADGLKLKGNYIDQITTDQLVAGTAKIGTAMIENLVVGSNVQMGSGASISWSQVTNQPHIPSVPSYITSTKITSTSIESPNITGGTITGGTFRTSNNENNITISNDQLTSGSSSNSFLNLSSGIINISNMNSYYSRLTADALTLGRYGSASLYYFDSGSNGTLTISASNIAFSGNVTGLPPTTAVWG